MDTKDESTEKKDDSEEMEDVEIMDVDSLLGQEAVATKPLKWYRMYTTYIDVPVSCT